MPAMFTSKMTLALVRESSTKTHHSSNDQLQFAMSCGMLARQFALFVHTVVGQADAACARLHELREASGNPTALLTHPAAQDQEVTQEYMRTPTLKQDAHLEAVLLCRVEGTGPCWK